MWCPCVTKKWIIERLYLWLQFLGGLVCFHPTQPWIELKTSIPLTHQTRYWLNPNYATIVKEDINKLLATCFIKLIEEDTWLSPIVVMPKKNGKLKTWMGFRKFNATIKKDPYMLPFIDEVINIVAGHEVYTFLDSF